LAALSLDCDKAAPSGAEAVSAAARLADVLDYLELQQAGAGRDRVAALARVGFPP
jgi:hypothetical protein